MIISNNIMGFIMLIIAITSLFFDADSITFWGSILMSQTFFIRAKLEEINK